MRKIFSISNTYLRFLLIMVIVLIIIISSFSFLLSNIYTKYTYSQINSFNEYKLTQIKDNVNFLLRKLKSYSIIIYEDLAIQNWFGLESSDNYTFEDKIFIDMDARNNLSRFILTEPYIENAYLINTSIREVIDFKNGQQTFAEFHDQKVLDKVQYDTPKLLRYFTYKIDGQNHLFLIVPSTPIKNQYNNGYLVIILDNQLLNQYLLDNRTTTNIDTEIDVKIIDDQGELILGNQDEKYSILQNISYTKLDNSRISADSKEWYVNFSEFEDKPWNIIYLTYLEQLHTNIRSIQIKILIYTLITVLIISLVLYWISRKNYKPYSNLAKQIRIKYSNLLDQSLENKESYQEYKLIKNFFDIANDRIDQMYSQIKDHSKMIKQQYLKQWLLQGKLTEPAKNYLADHSKIISAKAYRISIIRIDSYSKFKEENDFKSRRLWKFAMGNISRDLINNDIREIESIDLGNDHIILLIYYKRKIDNEDLDSVLQEVQSQIAKITKIDVTIAVSEVYSSYENIRDLYNNIYELTNLKFLTGEEKVYHEIDIEKYSEITKPLPDDSLINQVIIAIRLREGEKIKELFASLFSHLKHTGYEECRFQLTYIMYNIFKSFKNISTLQSYESIERQLEKHSTIEEIRNWLEKEVEVIMMELQKNETSDRQEEISLEIVEYIKHNLTDPMLNVDDIADNVSLSSSYIRKVFKEVMKTSISNYILNERLERVKKYLITTEQNVTDIGEQCGFQSKSHFFHSFKKHVGMTPAQYREQNRDK